MSFIINPYAFAVASSFDTDYQAVLDRGTALGYTLPNAAYQTKGNQFVLDLKAAGLWTIMDVLYVFWTNVGDHNFACLNWKSPTTFQITEVSSPTFTNLQGFNGNGTTSYLNTGWKPGTNGVNFTLNDAAISHYGVNNTQDAGREYGCQTATASTRSWLTTRNAADSANAVSLNGTSVVSNASTDSSGMWINTRNGSLAADNDLYREGTLFDNSNSASGTVSTTDMYIGAHNNNGTAANFSARQIAFFAAGANMQSGSRFTDLGTAFNTYKS